MLSCADIRDCRCMTGLQKRNDCGKMVLRSENRCIPFSMSCSGKSSENKKESDKQKDEREG